MKKYLSIILSVALLINLADVSHIKADSFNVSASAGGNSLFMQKGKGYIKPDIKISKNTAGSGHMLKSSNLPSSYDLRAKGYLTSVKDQGQINDC